MWYVAVDFVIEAGMFPARVTVRDAKRIGTARRWTRYLDRSIQTLNAAAPDAFTPSLISIDALVQSVTFEGMPGTESSTLPSGS